MEEKKVERNEEQNEEKQEEKQNEDVMEFDLSDKDMQRISQMRQNEEALKNKALMLLKGFVSFLGENQMVEQQQQESMRIFQEKFETPENGEFEIFPDQKKLVFKKK